MKREERKGRGSNRKEKRETEERKGERECVLVLRTSSSFIRAVFPI
jgi:hypothetical protein